MFRQKTKTAYLCAPVTGKSVSLENSHDEAFASKLIGDGVAIMPVEGEFRSPADGRITGIAEARHAYTLETPDGLEILVHIGIDTVELRGEFFTPNVSVGDTVHAGDVICVVDTDAVTERGFSLCTPVVVSNADELCEFSPIYGDMIGGSDAVIEYKVRK